MPRNLFFDADDNANGTYTFIYDNPEDGRHIEYRFNARHDDETMFWTEIHSRFLNFLSSVFGYEIRDQVMIGEKFTVQEYDTEKESYGGNDE